MTGTKVARESGEEHDLDAATARRQWHDQRRMQQGQRSEEHYAEGRRVRMTPDEHRQDQRTRCKTYDREQRAREQHPPRRAPDVRQGDAPLTPHTMPDGT